MKEAIMWLIATVIVGVVLYLIERLIPLDGGFQLVVRVMCGIVAIIFFVLFLLAVLKVAGLALPV